MRIVIIYKAAAMPVTIATPLVRVAYLDRAGHRFSAGTIAGIAAAHAGLLALLVSLNVVPLPTEVETLMVQMIAPAPPPSDTRPRPPAVERKPAPRPTPAPRPQTLVTQAATPDAVAETPPINTAPPRAVPAPAAPVAITEARFDADYLQNPAPGYPAAAKRMGEEGKVVLRVFVEPTGRPGQIEIKTSSASPRLDQAALDAVWRWKFVAARRGDEAIGAWVLVPIVFNLRS